MVEKLWHLQAAVDGENIMFTCADKQEACGEGEIGCTAWEAES
jgi:hypothetical protein